MMRLLTFGGLALEKRDGSPPPRLRPQRFAMLAVLANAGDHGISRDRIAALFWPDSEDPKHSLRQALYALRQELGADVILNNGLLALDRDILSSDIAEFRSAIASGDRTRAAELASGPFLNGFNFDGSDGFERWLEEQRAAVTADATRILLALAKDAHANNELEAAADWWKRLTILDPLSGRFALGYLKALANSGDRAGALAFVRAHERLVRRELESDPDPEIRRLETELRAIPSPAVVLTPPTARRSIVFQPDETPPTAKTPRVRWRSAFVMALLFVGVAGTFAAVRWRTSQSKKASAKTPTFAVGMIREEGVPDTLRIGGVLTDMLATNLARVGGMSVLANSRLFELMLPGQDTLPAGYSDAARRAGATEILQGRLLSGPEWTLAMEIQRVDLSTGLVKGAYRVAAPDRYALVDSMTNAIARDMRLGSPVGSIADATTDNPVAYRLYEEGLRSYYQYDEAAAARLMQAALQEDSTFAMAAYFAARSVGNSNDLRASALRLARLAPERERLTITADLQAEDMYPEAAAIADSLTAKYPMDPRGYEFLWKSRFMRGDWALAVTAIERAIALDSASEPAGRQGCRLCSDLSNLANTYFWWDSLPAAERTAQRIMRLRPQSHGPWDILIRSTAARGDTTAQRVYIRHFRESNPTTITPDYFARRDILLEEYDRAEPIIQSYLESPKPDELANGVWLQTIVFRNQGRLTEALKLANSHPAPADMNLAVASLDAGDARTALSKLRTRASDALSAMSPSLQARNRAWNYTLLGMAEVVARDTAAVRRLADSVEYWGGRSLYGRDRRAHHYLRGMLSVAEGRDNDAAVHLREAIHSPTNGFTRVNYELGKVLLRLNRPAEAIPIVRAALHGDIDGSNLYVTRTELHELLGQAFDRVGNRDSAAVHYRAVARAWVHADARFQARHETIRAWLAANSGLAKPRS